VIYRINLDEKNGETPQIVPAAPLTKIVLDVRGIQIRNNDNLNKFLRFLLNYDRNLKMGRIGPYSWHSIVEQWTGSSNSSALSSLRFVLWRSNFAQSDGKERQGR
jgi:hypothetical protein